MQITSMLLRPRLVRLILIALAFASVSTTLSSLPATVLDYWYLYYCPVLICALSFGLRGALAGSVVAIAATVILLFRLHALLLLSGQDVVTRIWLLSGADAPALQHTLSNFAQVAGANTAAPGLDLDVTGDILASLVKVALGSALVIGVSCIVGLQWDRQVAQAIVARRQALTDALTGLSNYRGLMEGLEGALDQAGAFGLLLGDLDNMKEINDHYGHAAGDAALIMVAGVLREATRSNDLLARTGGDEFVVVLGNAADTEAQTALQRCHTVAGRVLELLAAQPLMLPSGEKVPVRMSIGIAAYPLHGARTADLLGTADAGLYAAKRSGGHRLVLFAKEAPAT